MAIQHQSPHYICRPTSIAEASQTESRTNSARSIGPKLQYKPCCGARRWV